MRRLMVVLVVGLSMGVMITATRATGEKDMRVYELRTYYANPDKLEALHARFRDHTVKLFAKHGITNVGYWVPVENPESKLVYVVSFPDRESRQKSFQAFGADPEWRKVVTESEANGRLVARIESVLMSAADYSPELKVTAAGDRVFELRSYTASAGNLGHLNDRFRNHTINLFAKHGMTNVVYWNLLSDQKDSDKMLIYLLAHKSVEAARASFDKFRQDPDWLAARKASEDKAGGSLTAPDGVKSVFMKATDYSPMR